MLHIGNKPIDTMYVGGKLVQQVYLESKKIYPEHGVIPKAIKDAMVLWYDIKRQGATNESMAENPVLRDLSGNGHDATCYNFAWTEQSGISATDYPDAIVSDGVDDYAVVTNLPAQYPNGYTVIAKRNWLNTDNQACLCGNRGDANTDSAFSMELLNFSDGKFRCDSFKYQRNIDMDLLQREGIVYQKTFDYNGQTELNPRNIGNGYKSTTLFKLNPDNVSYYNGAIALYSFLLFNRDLTDEEIEWVKTNLIETEE